MAEQGDMKEVKRVLVGPLIANNPIFERILFDNQHQGCQMNSRKGRLPVMFNLFHRILDMFP